MKTISNLYAAILITLSVSSPAYAESCLQSAEHLHREMDALIEEWIASGPRAPESVVATQGHQPTPYLIATAARNASDFEQALDSLDRAREADRAGNARACKQEIAKVTTELRRYGRTLSRSPTAQVAPSVTASNTMQMIAASADAHE